MVINLVLSTVALGPLALWEISEDYLAVSDHKLILLRWEIIDVSLSQSNPDKAIGWDIQGLMRDKNQLNKAKKTWVTESRKRLILD